MSLVVALGVLLQDELAFQRGQKVAEGKAIVGFSRDGKSFLVARPGQAANEYALSLGRPGSAELVKLHDAITGWDDVLPAQFTADAFSRDGSRIAFPGSVPWEDKTGRNARVLVSDRTGKVESVPTQKSESWYPAWSPAADELFFIETQDYRAAQAGYSIRRYRPDTHTAETVYENRDELPLLLRVSPDGKRLAFMSGTPTAPRKVGEVRLRILAPADRSVVDSEPFFLDDFVADGSPPIHWHPEGKGVWFYRSPDDRRAPGPERYQGAYFDLEARRTEKLTDDYTLYLLAVLDADHLLMIAGTPKRGELKSGVLRVSDRKRYLLPGSLLAIGGSGRTVAVQDPKEKGVYLGQIEIPK